MDQQVVARLRFGSEPNQCWNSTKNLAPGVYWVQVHVDYASGGSVTNILATVLQTRRSQSIPGSTPLKAAHSQSPTASP